MQYRALYDVFKNVIYILNTNQHQKKV